MAETKSKKETKEPIEEKIDYKQLNIYQKMSIATSKIEKVIKGLTVGEGKYAYKAVSDKDVNNAVKPIEAEIGIYSYPYARVIRAEDRETFTTSRGTNLNFVIKLETTYRFINVDKPDEFIDITTYGYGIDAQDKAPGKAMTYSDKYALLKAYKIETGDDPDQKPSEEVSAVPVEITEEYAKNYTLNFGKYKGKKLSDLFEEDEGYIEWLLEYEKADETIKKCINLLYKINEKNVIKEQLDKKEQDEKLALINKTNMLFDITKTDRDKVYEYYKVTSNSEMTLVQLRELVAVLERRQN